MRVDLDYEYLTIGCFLRDDYVFCVARFGVLFSTVVSPDTHLKHLNRVVRSVVPVFYWACVAV